MIAAGPIVLDGRQLYSVDHVAQCCSKRSAPVEVTAGWKAARAEASLTAQIQMALDAWVSERATSEKMTGAAAYISFGEPGPAIEVFAEKVGAGPQDPPVRQNTLFQRI